MSLKKDLERLEYDARARKVNAIKKDGAASQYGELVQLELADWKDKFIGALAQCTENNEGVSAIVHRLQGLEICKATILNDWPLEENKETPDA